MRGLQEKKGITLIALIVTVIILLILAGVSVSMIDGSGLFGTAKESSKKYTQAQLLEKLELAKAEYLMDNVNGDSFEGFISYLQEHSEEYGISNIEVDGGEVTLVTEEGYVYSVTNNNGEIGIVGYGEESDLPTIEVTATPYQGTYDGTAHGISVVSETSGATITYSTDGSTYTSELPTFTQTGGYTTYYKVKKEGYKTVSGSITVTISRANGGITLSSSSGAFNGVESKTITVSNNTGTVSAESSNTNAAEVSVIGNEVTITSKTVSEQTNVNITITSQQSTNYEEAQATYVATVKPLVASFRYVKLNITKLRSAPNDGCVQLAEFTFMKNNGEKFTHVNTSVTSSLGNDGSSCVPSKMIDNNVNTKFCSSRTWGNNAEGNCDIVFDFGNSNKIDIMQYTSYSYTTANDQNSRDPVSWKLMVSNDGTNYIVVDIRSNENITTSRNTQTSKYQMTIPEKDETGNYSLILDANGGINGPNNIITENANYFTIPQTIPTRANYFFNGWTTNNNGTGTLYNVGDKIIVNGRVTLYAKWLDSNYCFRYLKINITKIRTSCGIVQLSELNFWDNNGNKFAYPSTTSISANLTEVNSSVVASKLIDGLSNTKYCTERWGSNQTGSCLITLNLGADKYLDISKYTKFSYTTADDANGRDPISWVISGSNNNSTFYNICTVNDASITTSRQTQTQKFNVSR